ncbi:MAG: hypothetical protein ABI831_12420 [Betaproteobacteria bacterium]
MADRSKSGCGCGKTPGGSTLGEQLGLDELMIVNPGSFRTAVYTLAGDGTLYQVQGLGQVDEPQGIGSFFLGEDGTLYQVQGAGPSGPARLDDAASEGRGNVAGHSLARHFLGADGTLYEFVPPDENAKT